MLGTAIRKMSVRQIEKKMSKKKAKNSHTIQSKQKQND